MGNVGGLVGHNIGGSINTSYATGAVFASTITAGGLLGYNNGGTVSNSYATGAVVAATHWIGGLVGYNDNIISNCYATGTATGNIGALGVAGLVGGAFSSGVTNSYWDISTSRTIVGQGYNAMLGATGLTTAQMQQQANFTGWDFVNTWQIAPNAYPTLKAFTPSAGGTTPIITPTPPVPSPLNPVPPVAGIIDPCVHTPIICAVAPQPFVPVVSAEVIIPGLIDAGKDIALDTTKEVLVNLSDNYIANIKAANILALADNASKQVGLLNKVNLNGLSAAERQALQSQYAKSARAWYSEAALTKTKVSKIQS